MFKALTKTEAASVVVLQTIAIPRLPIKEVQKIHSKAGAPGMDGKAPSFYFPNIAETNLYFQCPKRCLHPTFSFLCTTSYVYSLLGESPAFI